MNRLPPALAAELGALAALPQTPRGAIVRLAAEFGRSAGSLRVLVHRRRYGSDPGASIDRSPLAFLTGKQRDTYFVLKRNRYTRAEALAAMGIER